MFDDVLGLIVPEYAGKVSRDYIPQSNAEAKTDYIESRKATIKAMEKEIAELEATIKEIKDKKSYSYQAAVKKLKKCREIKQNCEFSIKLTETQVVQSSVVNSYCNKWR